MTEQLRKYAPFYLGVAGLGFTLGWLTCRRLITFGEEFDTRVDGRW